MTTLEQVKQFHEAFGVETADKPYINNQPLNQLRIKLLVEELEELSNALDERDEIGALDALCDLQYVLDGAFLALGFAKYKEAGMALVHASNMSKRGPDGKPIKRADGKILKGPGFTPVDLRKLLHGASPMEETIQNLPPQPIDKPKQVDMI